MNNSIDKVISELNQNILDIGNELKSDDVDSYKVSLSLKEFIKVYDYLINEISNIHKFVLRDSLQDYLNNSRKINVSGQKNTLEDLKKESENLVESIRKLEDKITEQKTEQEYLESHQETYDKLLEDEASIRADVEALKAVKSKVDANGIQKLQEELILLESMYSDKKIELDKIEQDYNRQMQIMKEVKLQIENKLEQIKYNDNLEQLQSDIESVIEEYEKNYFHKKQEGSNILRFRVDFTRRVSGHLLSKPQYDRLDDITKALDEIDDKIKTQIVENRNATSS